MTTFAPPLGLGTLATVPLVPTLIVGQPVVVQTAQRVFPPLPLPLVGGGQVGYVASTG